MKRASVYSNIILDCRIIHEILLATILFCCLAFFYYQNSVTLFFLLMQLFIKNVTWKHTIKNWKLI